MKRWTKRTVKVIASAAFAVGMVGCIMHALMPHAHPPEPSEFGMGPRRSTSGAYAASIIADEGLAVRKMQTVRVAIVDSMGAPVEGASVAVDGGMPAHGHGLPTQPRVTRALGGGEYLVEGLRFNMGGWWVLHFAVDGSLGQDTITFNLDL